MHEGAFSKLYGVFYAASHFDSERQNCPGGEILQEDREGTQGLGEKKVCNCREWLVQGKGGGDICWWNDF